MYLNLIQIAESFGVSERIVEGWIRDEGLSHTADRGPAGGGLEGSPFTEADGTTYTPSGTPTGPGTATSTLTTGDVEVSGVTLHIEGTVARAYTVVVVD